MLNFSPSCLLFYTIVSVTILFCCVPLSIATGSNETDRLALLQIKAQIRGDPLGVTSSWNDTLHFCEWYGVTCGHKHRQRVTSLDLRSSKLTGTLSPHLGNLTFLRKLHLQNNSFGGTIPPEISHLHRLQYLRLTNNSMGGEIPSNISSCYNLVYLHLDGNRLVGDIPPILGSLSRLQSLDLSNNNLTGNIPSSLGNLSSLVELYTIFNNLVGSIPASLAKLKNLTNLDLAANKLSGVVPPSIFNLSSLINVEIGTNNLEGELPSDLGNTLPHLQWFSVQANRFTGHIPTSISNSSSLNVLELNTNNLHGQVPPLNKLVKLTRFSIFQNSLGSDLMFLNSFVNATSLQSLEINFNNFKGVFPKILCNFSSLNVLGMDSNFLTGEIPYCIENLLDLQYFGVENNLLSGIIPPGIGKLQKLFYIILDNNQLSGVIPPSIGNLTKLSIFGLFNNNLKGQIPSTLGNCGSLITLSLSNNSLSGSIPPQLFSLSSLSIGLDLSGNHLTGSLPEEVGQLKNLDWLDVSRNMLSGQIPSSLGSCMSLEYLYMGRNYFQGTIPDSLALKGLVELDLSYNNFSGKIPQFLQTLKLQSLDLSKNNLEGEVPIDGVFNNASGVYVSGNSKLCGGIPELKLPVCINNQKRKLMHRKIVLTVAILCGFSGVILILGFLVLIYILWQKKRTKKPMASDDSENFPNLSYQMLLNATNGFSSDNLIGSGTFGDVFKGVLEELQSTVAIKVFNLQNNHGAFKSFMAECGVIRNIRHRNLLKVVTACSSVDYQGRDFKALVYEYMVNGSLDDWLHPPNSINGVLENNNSSRHLSLRQRLDIAVDVAFSLDYLHNHCGASIVHCDLKPSNVLLDDEMVAHVGDFGLAKFLSKGINGDFNSNQSSSIGVRGTIGYAPPEYGMGNEVSTSGDVYSFGILLLEMITGKRPTDDMFKGGLTLHGFVREALAGDVVEILDHVLLEDIINSTDSNLLLEALTSVLEIALSCSTEVPAERLDMSIVSAKLSSTKNKLLGTRLQQRRRIRGGARG